MQDWCHAYATRQKGAAIGLLLVAMPGRMFEFGHECRAPPLQGAGTASLRPPCAAMLVSANGQSVILVDPTSATVGHACHGPLFLPGRARRCCALGHRIGAWLYDLIIRDGTVVSGAGRVVADVAVQDGRIAYVGSRPPQRAREEFSAMGRLVLPGAIDLAVDFGPSDGWSSASAVVVAQGVTTVVHLPGSWQAEHDAMAVDSACDWASWVVPEGSPAATRPPVVGLRVHGDGRMDTVPQAEGATRVVVGPDVAAIEAALRWAADRGGRRVHVLGVSSDAGLAALGPHRSVLTASVPLPALVFTSDDPPSGTAVALGGDADRRALWAAIRRGQVAAVCSMHGVDGLPSAERLLPAMLAAVRHGRLQWEAVVALLCEGPADVIGAPHKGRVTRGADADIVVWNDAPNRRVPAGALGWAGRDVAPPPDVVYIRGRAVARQGVPVASIGLGRPLAGVGA